MIEFLRCMKSMDGDLFFFDYDKGIDEVFDEG